MIVTREPSHYVIRLHGLFITDTKGNTTLDQSKALQVFNKKSAQAIGKEISNACVVVPVVRGERLQIKQREPEELPAPIEEVVKKELYQSRFF